MTAFIRTYRIPLIFALAIVLRALRIFWGFGSSQFSCMDETGAYFYSLDVVYYSNSQFFASFLPGPLQNLIGYAAMHLTGSAAGMYIVPFCLQTATLFLLHAFLKKVADETTVWIGLLVFAVHPWAVGFGSSFWNPYFIIPLALAAMLLLIDIIERERSRLIAPLILLFGAMPFFHGMAFFGGIAVIAILIIYRPRLNIAWLAIGIGVTILLLYVPFFYFDAQHGFFISRAYAQQSKGAVALTPEFLKIITNPLVVLLPDGSRFIGRSYQQFSEFASRYFFHPALVLAGVIPYAIAAIFGFFHFFRRVFVQRERRDSILLIFGVATFTAFLFTLRANEDRYMVIIWGTLFYILALGIREALRRWNTAWTKAIVVVMVIFAAYMSIAISAFQRYPNGERYRVVGSLMYYERIQDIVLAHYNLPSQHFPRLGPQLPRSLLPAYRAEAPRTVNTIVRFDHAANEIFDWDNRLRKWNFNRYADYQQWISQPAYRDKAHADVMVTSRQREVHFSTNGFSVIGYLPNGVVMLKERSKK